jgi:hypothetical protein
MWMPFSALKIKLGNGLLWPANGLGSADEQTTQPINWGNYTPKGHPFKKTGLAPGASVTYYSNNM